MKNYLFLAISTLLLLSVTPFSMAAEPAPAVVPAEPVLTAQTTEDSAVAGQSTDAPSVTSESVSTPLTTVKAFYFHTSRRCKTCLSIEANAKEALNTGFAAEIAEGLLSWEEVNFEEKEKAHYVKDFDLMFSSVIVVKYQDGKQVEWKNLQKVWELVRDKPAFTDYVQSEVKAWLES
jgi:hypothetical protein